MTRIRPYKCPSARCHLRGAEEYDAALAGAPAELAAVRCVWRIYVCYGQRRLS
jgi:hypothetical protein